MKQPCSVQDCDRAVYGRGWCKKHWQHWYRRGVTDPPPLPFKPLNRTRPITPLETPCREWQGPWETGGYGYRYMNGKRVQVHRWVVEQIEGPLLPGEHVLHRCDNPPCFRYDHLVRGTAKNNHDDMVAKTRGNVIAQGRTQGEASFTHRLTESEVLEIRRRYNEGEGPSALGREYGVSRRHIQQIVKRAKWRHI